MEDDVNLIKRYLKGEEDCLRVLIDRYTSSIYNFTVRFIGPIYTPDIVQEIFIKVWKNLKNFDEDRSQFKTWLFIIARNSITDYYRKKKTVPFSYLGEDEFKEEEIEDNSILPDAVYQKLQDKEMLDKVLNELPENYRTVLTLYYQEDMTFKEIGEVLNKPLNTVKSYHLRAIILLKKLCTKS